MGVIITDEMLGEAAPGTDALEAIARAWRRVRSWIDRTLAVPGSPYTVRDSKAVVFIDRPVIEGHHFDREISRTAIVCGNCAGIGERPQRTLLIRDPLTQVGSCADCGGSSYVLASRCYRGRR